MKPPSGEKDLLLSLIVILWIPDLNGHANVVMTLDILYNNTNIYPVAGSLNINVYLRRYNVKQIQHILQFRAVVVVVRNDCNGNIFFCGVIDTILRKFVFNDMSINTCNYRRINLL